MKIRTGFVSNSSSASFIIKLDALTSNQLRIVLEHEEKAKGDAWEVYITQNSVCAETMMDNFDLIEYLIENGIDKSIIECEGQNYE